MRTILTNVSAPVPYNVVAWVDPAVNILVTASRRQRTREVARASR